MISEFGAASPGFIDSVPVIPLESVLKWVLKHLMEYILSVLYAILLKVAIWLANFIAGIFMPLLETFLFAPPVSEFTGAGGNLDQLYNTVVTLSISLYISLTMGYIIAWWVYIERPGLDLVRHFKRSFAALLGILLFPVLVNHATLLVHVLGKTMYPSGSSFHMEYSGQVLGDLAVTEALGAHVTAVLALIAVMAVSAMGVFVVILLLAARAILIYSTFVLSPLLAVIWVFDIGFLKKPQQVVASYLSLFGMAFTIPILVSGILLVGGTMASAGTGSAHAATDVGTITASDVQVGESLNQVLQPATGGQPSVQAASKDQRLGVIVRIAFFFGSLGLSIIVVTRLLGTLVAGSKLRKTSTPVRNAASKLKKQRRDDDDDEDEDVDDDIDQDEVEDSATRSDPSPATTESAGGQPSGSATGGDAGAGAKAAGGAAAGAALAYKAGKGTYKAHAKMARAISDRERLGDKFRGFIETDHTEQAKQKAKETKDFTRKAYEWGRDSYSERQIKGRHRRYNERQSDSGTSGQSQSDGQADRAEGDNSGDTGSDDETASGGGTTSGGGRS